METIACRLAARPGGLHGGSEEQQGPAMLSDYFTAIRKICASAARAAESGPYLPVLTSVQRLAGCCCRIYLHKEVSDSREQAVEALGGAAASAAQLPLSVSAFTDLSRFPKGTSSDALGQ